MCLFYLGPILLVKLAKQSKIARFCQNVDAQWYCCYGQVVRHVPFVVGIHLGPLTSKVVPIKTKIWKQGTTKKDKASTKKLLLFRNLGWHPHYQSDSKTVAIQDKHKTKKYDEIFAFYWSWLAVLYLYWLAFMLLDWRQGQSTPRYLLRPLSPATNHLANYFLHLDK